MINEKNVSIDAVVAIEETDELRRETKIRYTYEDDVRTLQVLVLGRTGVSAICKEVLSCIHHKRGTIDVTGLRQLDPKNRLRVLRLLDVLSSPGMISDGFGLRVGIMSDGNKKALLTDVEIEELGIEGFTA
jgi:hypothetical protein